MELQSFEVFNVKWQRELLELIDLVFVFAPVIAVRPMVNQALDLTHRSPI
jgi:hypothetical protein